MTIGQIDRDPLPSEIPQSPLYAESIEAEQVDIERLSAVEEPEWI